MGLPVCLDYFDRQLMFEILEHLRQIDNPTSKLHVHLTFSQLVGICHLLIIFAISLDPVQARQNVGSDLDPDSLTLGW